MAEPINIVQSTVQEARDEVARELSVRERYYGRWVQEGKLSKTDAKVRLSGIRAAALVLAAAHLHLAAGGDLTYVPDKLSALDSPPGGSNGLAPF
jgi:hypothetical protein